MFTHSSTVQPPERLAHNPQRPGSVSSTRFRTWQLCPETPWPLPFWSESSEIRAPTLNQSQKLRQKPCVQAGPASGVHRTCSRAGALPSSRLYSFAGRIRLPATSSLPADAQSFVSSLPVGTGDGTGRGRSVLRFSPSLYSPPSFPFLPRRRSAPRRGLPDPSLTPS